MSKAMVQLISSIEDEVPFLKTEKGKGCLFCEGEATHVAIHGSSWIRCCDKEACQKNAIDMALQEIVNA